MVHGGKDHVDSRFTLWAERMKRRPFVVAFIAVAAVVAFAGTVVGLTVDLGTFFSPPESVPATSTAKPVDTRALESEALASIELDVTAEYFEQRFGVPKTSIDPCGNRTCQDVEPGALSLNTYESERATVRAIFDTNRLAFNAVVANAEDLPYDMTWLGHELGRLGRVSFADALGEAGITEPTDAEIFLGPRSVAYAEVFWAGAPAEYRGLYLANAPYGSAGENARFDLDAAWALQESQEGNGVLDPLALADFRRLSRPDTFGEFRDDGPVAALVKEGLVSILYLGVEGI